MAENVPLQWLDWPAPRGVNACFSLRAHVDEAAADRQNNQTPFNDFNYGLHVGDQPERVAYYRRCLAQTIGHHTIQWLDQVHGVDIVKAEGKEPLVADAVYTQEPAKVCAVMTADCLPVFFCDQQANQVAIAHAGWRGLAAGVLQQTLAKFKQPDAVMVYFGPAISQSAFEVGSEVREAFIHQLPVSEECFIAKENNQYMADLYRLAKCFLSQQGIKQFYGGNRCTYTEESMFFSYRRDGQTGRMVNLIWLD